MNFKFCVGCIRDLLQCLQCETFVVAFFDSGYRRLAGSSVKSGFSGGRPATTESKIYIPDGFLQPLRSLVSYKGQTSTQPSDWWNSGCASGLRNKVRVGSIPRGDRSTLSDSNAQPSDP